MSDRRESETGTVGTMQGMPPGRKVHHIGVLDLRGVPFEQVERIEEIGTVEVLILDEDNRSALQQTKMHHIGSVLVARPDERVIVTPQLEVSGSGMEGMAGSQKVLLLGSFFFLPDVPPALVAEKFDSLRVAGILIACAGVHGVLLGKMQLIHGINLILPDDVGPVTRSAGDTCITPDYLLSLPDDTTYLNVGRTELARDVAIDLLQQKLRAYYNAGETIGPSSLISVLQARCPSNSGSFQSS